MAGKNIVQELAQEKLEFDYLQRAGEVIRRRNERRMEEETNIKTLRKQRDKIVREIRKTQERFCTDSYHIGKMLSQIVKHKKLSLQTQLLTATKDEAQKLIAEFAMWKPSF